MSNASTVAAGHVYRITAPHHAPDVDLRGVASTGMGAQARHLLTLDEAGRRAWLDQQPADALGNHNWWSHLFGHLDVRIREQPLRRPAWVELRLWLLSHAATVGVLNPRELAEHRARFVAGLYARAITTGLDSILPTADDLVAACLAAIPVTPAEATAIDNWRGEALDTIRRLRQAKNLITPPRTSPARTTRNSPPTSTCGSDSRPGWPDDRGPQARVGHLTAVHIGIRCARGVLGRHGTAVTKRTSQHDVVATARTR